MKTLLKTYRHYFFFLCFLLNASSITGQGMILIDSLKNLLKPDVEDTSQALLLAAIGYRYRNINTDSTYYYTQKTFALSRKLNYIRGEAKGLVNMGWFYRMTSDYKKAILYLNQAEKICIEHNFYSDLGSISMARGTVYWDLKDYDIAKKYQLNAKDIFNKIGEYNQEVVAMQFMVDIYESEQKYDSAFYYANMAYHYGIKLGAINSYSITTYKLAKAYFQLNKNDSAYYYMQKAYDFGIYERNTRVRIHSSQLKGELLARENQIDSAIYYCQEAYQLAYDYNFFSNALYTSEFMAGLYLKKNDAVNALKYKTLAGELKDTVYGVNKMVALQKEMIDQQNQESAEREHNIMKENRQKQFYFLLIMAILASLIFIQMRNNKKIKRLNELEKIQKQKAEDALQQLKATQTQLIQSEKLASLGELTAGIAHEIQNPLNFVNNFSELSVDLVKDLKEEIEKPTQDKAYIGELFDDLSQNQEKINHHGKRASSIVKGMLEHSRTSTGVKELTDINKLADEYLRLSYHGLRAKDKDFNADFKTEFDENLPKIEVIPQDIGRVLLNLINNAFYAVHQREQLSESSQLSESYTPSVLVSTKQLDNQIIIKVKDNGIGMSEATKAKVFQPFFTTKPTGQGTGLGLSLAYDIVTKGHGGTLEVESTEGVGTTFIVTLSM